MGYTKGEWEVHYPNVIADGWNVCEVSGEPRKDLEEAAANARLIAAAPRLLEALKVAERWLKRILADDHVDMEMIHLALAKIEGVENGKP